MAALRPSTGRRRVFARRAPGEGAREAGLAAIPSGIGRPSAAAWRQLRGREVRAWWLFGPGSVVAHAVSGLPARLTIVGATTGPLIALLIISPIGRSSGGHFNPAVSVTFWLLRRMARRDVTAYVVAQLAGSVIGVLLGRVVLGPVVADPAVNYAALRPAGGWSSTATFFAEAAFFALLMVAVVAFLSQPALALWTPAVSVPRSACCALSVA